MLIIAYTLAIFIGITLGLIGSGGSILTIPVLVYLMHIEPQSATTYSLFVVGIVSLIGSYKCFQEKIVDFRIALLFGLPSVISIFIMRKFINPIIPNTILDAQNFSISKNMLIMLVFATFMILASVVMIKPQKQFLDKKSIRISHLVVLGIIVGIITGFVGVGGGFLIIPSLVFYAKMSMKKAVATSLIIIATNALFGFVGSVSNATIQWDILLTFTAFATIGIFIGRYLVNYVPNERVKPIFGWFVLITGIYILIREIF